MTTATEPGRRTTRIVDALGAIVRDLHYDDLKSEVARSATGS